MRVLPACSSCPVWRFATWLKPVDVGVIQTQRGPRSSLQLRLMPREKSELKRGERRQQILQALAAMLEQPRWEKITTAALAARLEVSEAALYRHFASKAQMYEGLIEFIEHSVFTLTNRISADETDPRRHAPRMLELLLAFAEKNPGMVRVMIGEALVGEHERLQARMNQFFDRFEATLKQALKLAAADAQGGLPAEEDPGAHAAALTRYALGCLHVFARSGFAKKPSEQLAPHWHYIG